MAPMRSKHVAKTFKCISTYNCVFYYIIVVSDMKYIQSQNFCWKLRLKHKVENIASPNVIYNMSRKVVKLAKCWQGKSQCIETG